MSAKLLAENARLREALRPFTDLSAQRGAWGVISKKLGEFAPMTVVVTKAQMREALAALSDRNDIQAGGGEK